MTAKHFSLKPMPNVLKNVDKAYSHAVKYDIKNGFDHIPKHPDFRKYFTIQIDGNFYQPTTMVMGETCAPWAFQMWLHNMFTTFKKEHNNIEIDIINKQHIDDLLFLRRSAQDLIRFREL
ncbi:hypothetical protein BGZ46_009868 [Entomortierella lignicola]|nr:hypothetical protein BGZ46_009868 [Entomortierella lignicola]